MLHAVAKQETRCSTQFVCPNRYRTSQETDETDRFDGECPDVANQPRTAVRGTDPRRLSDFPWELFRLRARKFPWMKIDRPGAAIIGAVLMVAFRIVGPQEALQSIDFPTIVLLFR